MTEIELIDLKGDYWKLILGAIQINNRNGCTYAYWYVIDGPESLTAPPYKYDAMLTPIFTEWFA